MIKDILSAVPIVGDIIKQIIPDKNEQNAALARLDELSTSGAINVQLGQLAVNKEEAKHPSIFVSGWRPFIGWTCGTALFYNYIIYNTLLWIVALSGSDVVVPDAIDMAELWPVLGGILGLGAMRTAEKIKKVARNKWSRTEK